MEPTLRAGDRLLARYAALPAVGDVVLVRPEALGGRVAVKRVTAASGRDVVVESDNVAAEGAWAGVVARADVLAVVRIRLWPRPGAVRRRA